MPFSKKEPVFDPNWDEFQYPADETEEDKKYRLKLDKIWDKYDEMNE